MLYNVKVNGVCVWIEWTPDRWRALREYRAWLNVSELTCGAVRVSLALAPLGKRRLTCTISAT